MIFDYHIAQHAQCSIEKKRECITLISKIVELSEIARREGLLAIEDILDTMTHPLLIKGMELVIDGTEPDVVKTILSNYINFGGAKGKVLLEQCLVCEGVLSIQAGDNPKVIREKLVACLGGLDSQGSKNWSFLTEVESKFKEDEHRKLDNYLAKMKNKGPYSENTKILDEFVPQLSQEQIMVILREIDSTSLAVALSGASGKVITKIFNSVSEAYKPFLKDDLERCFNSPVKEIIDNQSRILTIYNNLKEHGII